MSRSTLVSEGMRLAMQNNSEDAIPYFRTAGLLDVWWSAGETAARILNYIYDDPDLNYAFNRLRLKYFRRVLVKKDLLAEFEFRLLETY